jgi:type 1 glutamine amidotransferase
MTAVTRLAAALAAALCLIPAVLHAADAPDNGGHKKKVVFVAGTPSHGFGAHEHNAGCLLLAKGLAEGMPQIETTVYQNGWPKDEHALDGADAIVMYCDGGDGHMVMPHLKEVQALVDKGVGIGCIHYAVEVPKDRGGPEFLDWIGGYFEAYRSINPHWKATFTNLPHHPVANGVKPFSTLDEWYYHMRFRDQMQDVTPILSAVPPHGLRGSDKAHNGNDEVHDPNRNDPEVVLWVSENPKTHSRGFGCTGGHFHWNWAQDDFRKTVLNAIVWIAKADVPADGVHSTRPTVDDLIAHQDEPVPANFDRRKIEKEIEEMNKPLEEQKRQ